MRMPIDTLDLKIKVFVTLSKIQKRLKTASSEICLHYYGGESFSITDRIPTSFFGYVAKADITSHTKPSELYAIVCQLVEKVVGEYSEYELDRFSLAQQAS
ncbi:MAG: hypothetical protein IGR93_04020 [Hydrococcus sp. C42_A2020_068]|nr:hypothetical protein [Hydrococcus sp. C42_A2020_068]